MTADGANIEAIYPLTPVQDGILFHTLLSPEAPLYIQQFKCDITGDLNVDDFVAAWQLVIDRHQTMRSLLTWKDRDQPLQIVRSTVEPEWAREDWRDLATADQDKKAVALLAADRKRGFDLETAPLMRFTLLRTADTTHTFVWTHHHIVIDGWSMGIVLEEVFRAYAALAAGAVPALETVSSYRDYVKWLKARDAEDDEAFWRDQLAGVDSATPLPTELTGRRGDPAESHAEVVHRLDLDATQKLYDFAKAQGVTLSTLLRAAWAMLLGRYSGDDKVVFGTSFSGRPPELDGALNMVGLFINTLPLRIDVQPGQEIGELLKQIHSQQLAMSPYETTPLPSVQRLSGVAPGDPLFESLLVFENVPNPTVGGAGLSLGNIRYLQRSNYPLALLVMPGDAIELIAIYDTSRFNHDFVDRMVAQLMTLLGALPGDPGRSLAELPIFPPQELSEIIVDWNATTADYPASHTIHELIRQVAATKPAAPAVIDAEQSLTYSELVSRADDLAAELARFGLAPNDRVGVLVERSAGAVVAMLGVLMAGAAYVPLDPELPPARLAILLDDTSARAVVAGEAVEAVPLEAPVVRITSAGRLHDTSTAAADPADRGGRGKATAGPDDLAYVLYTSGSTGRPKGVEVSHRNLVASTYARVNAYQEPVGAFLLLSPFIFDSSVAGLYSSLTQGGTLVLPAPRMEQDVNHLADLVARHHVTHTLALPSVYDLMLELANPGQLASLQVVMVAGEACPPRVIERHREALPNTTLANEYGPTEATVWCTVHRLHPGDAAQHRRVSIGRPIANTQAYILDPHNRPVPVGVAGELCIGGVGVTRGYLNQPELTAQSFTVVELPFVGAVRIYRTGDLARFMPDGTIDLLGRLDHQVKIRGQRVELGEVESVLESHGDVRAAAVIAHSGESSNARLVAYVESSGQTDLDKLRDFVASQLPNAMVPREIVVLSAIPRGATGKIDREALPSPPAEERTTTAFVAPQTPVEQDLAAIWSTVLGVDEVGATDNFFELGGDSILSMRIIARAHQAGLSITPTQFFETPTIAGLAERSGLKTEPPA